MTKLHCIKQGQGPVVVLAHALGCDLGMWDEVAALLEKRFTVVRYDHRNHGKSEAVTSRFSVDDMADDAAALIDSLQLGPVHFVGLSLGGMVAQSLAARSPSRVKSIVIANSAGHYDDAARAQWQAREETVLKQGMAAIADGALARWFSPGFLADPSKQARLAAIRSTLLACEPHAYAASCDAVKRIDFRASNPSITCPTLLIAGAADAATPPAMSEEMKAQIPGSRLVLVDAAHLSSVEQPQAFADTLFDFIPA